MNIAIRQQQNQKRTEMVLPLSAESVLHHTKNNTHD